jgi:recyclin-1
MDKFSPLEPTRLYQPAQTTSRFRSRSSVLQKAPIAPPLIGKLPADLHLLVLSFLPIPDFPSYARTSRQIAVLTRDEKIWERRWKALGVDPGSVLDELEAKVKVQNAANRANAPPTLAVDIVDDDFGDFASVNTFNGDFVNGFNAISLSATRPISTFRSKYTRAHNLLKPLLSKLSEPPHLVLSSLSTSLPNASLRLQAQTLHLLSQFLSPSIQPVRKWPTLYSSLRSAMDRFEANLLSAFEIADTSSSEPAMLEAASSSWEVYDPSSGDWELGKVWAEKREIFYEQARWKPLDNFKAGERLDFDAMDEFMGYVLGVLEEWGRRAVRVFPPQTGVLISFAERVSVDVVGEYITPLLLRAREISPAVFLQATAATFKEAWRMVDVIMDIVKEREDSMVERERAEDVV